MEFTNEQKNYAQVIQKAWEDNGFKQELINNPVEAIEKLIGEKLNIPAGKKLVVRDQTDNETVYINIPAKPEVDVELSESQLEDVAGGGKTLGDIIGGGCFPLPPIFEPFPYFPPPFETE